MAAAIQLAARCEQNVCCCELWCNMLRKTWRQMSIHTEEAVFDGPATLSKEGFTVVGYVFPLLQKTHSLHCHWAWWYFAHAAVFQQSCNLAHHSDTYIVSSGNIDSLKASLNRIGSSQGFSLVQTWHNQQIRSGNIPVMCFKTQILTTIMLANSKRHFVTPSTNDRRWIRVFTISSSVASPKIVYFCVGSIRMIKPTWYILSNIQKKRGNQQKQPKVAHIHTQNKKKEQNVPIFFKQNKQYYENSIMTMSSFMLKTWWAMQQKKQQKKQLQLVQVNISTPHHWPLFCCFSSLHHLCLVLSPSQSHCARKWIHFCLVPLQSQSHCVCKWICTWMHLHTRPFPQWIQDEHPSYTRQPTTGTSLPRLPPSPADRTTHTLCLFVSLLNV